MRINKYLAACGVFSRRKADEAVEAGRVTRNGEVAQMGSDVREGDVVCVDGKEVRLPEEKTYLAYYKPRGVECTADPRTKNNIIEALHYERRVTYAGRLDKWSEGLIVMTDDGDFIDRVMSAGDLHEKEYEVTVTEPLHPEDLKEMEAGVFLPELNRTTRPFRTRQVDSHRFRIILTEGINREIRRICALYGYRICKLRRVRIMNLTLGRLRPGEYRVLTQEEITSMRRQAGLDD